MKNPFLDDVRRKTRVELDITQKFRPSERPEAIRRVSTRFTNTSWT